MVDVEQGHAPCITLSLKHIVFLYQFRFRTTTCPKTVVGVWQRFAPFEMLSFQQILLVVFVDFHGDSMTVTKLRLIWPSTVFGGSTGMKSLVYFCYSFLLTSYILPLVGVHFFIFSFYIHKGWLV